MSSGTTGRELIEAADIYIEITDDMLTYDNRSYATSYRCYAEEKVK